MTAQNIHASCIKINQYGLLIRGASGSGKSDLVLRLLDEDVEAQLVADDQVLVTVEKGAAIMRSPEILAGLLEIRGQGLVSRPFAQQAQLTHIIDLVGANEIERMPDPVELQTTLMGFNFPRLKLYAFQASAPARIRAFLRG